MEPNVRVRPRISMADVESLSERGQAVRKGSGSPFAVLMLYTLAQPSGGGQAVLLSFSTFRALPQVAGDPLNPMPHLGRGLQSTFQSPHRMAEGDWITPECPGDGGQRQMC